MIEQTFDEFAAAMKKQLRPNREKLHPRHIMTRGEIDSLMAVKMGVSRTPSDVERDSGFQITAHETYRYMTGIAPLVKCKYFNDGKHPRYMNNPCDADNLKSLNTGNGGNGSVNFERIYDYGVASVVVTPLYTVDPVSEIPAQMIVGEITGMPLLRKITPEPTLRQKFGEHVNTEYDYDRDEYQNDVMNANPDDYGMPWANELTDGYKLSGDHTPSIDARDPQFVNIDFIPATLRKNWDKQPGAVQKLWIGRAYHYNRQFGRNDIDLSESLGKLFGIAGRTVRKYGNFAEINNTSGKLLPGGNGYRVPSVMKLPKPIDGDWELRMTNTPRKPWETMDGDRSYAEWGFDGPTDMAYAQRRAMLNNI